MNLMHYDVWMEGYAATGEYGTAQKLGSAKAASFKEACKIVATRQGMGELYSEATNTLWACKLHPTEEAARKAFG